MPIREITTYVDGVSDRVKFELLDYRNVEGPFDRIVSIGMFEHVGQSHFRAFFDKCRLILTDDGMMLLHTIGRMGQPGSTDAFRERRRYRPKLPYDEMKNPDSPCLFGRG